MGKLLKVIGIIVGLLVVVVVATAVILPLVIDPNDYKEEIVLKVQQQTGRDLRIDGPLKLSVFPWLGIEINGMELGNAKGFGDEPFAAVKHAAVRVKLMPLLSSRLEVDTVGLDGLVVNLAKDKNGRSNWDDLAKGEAAETQEPGDAGGGEAFTFTVGGVDIANARVKWDDRQSGQRYTVDQFSLSTGSVAPGRPVELSMGMQLESSEPPLQAKLRLGGTVSVDDRAGKVTVSGFNLVLDAEGEALSGGAMHAELGASVSAMLNGESVSVEELEVKSGDLQLSGALKGTGLTASPAFTGNLKLATFNLRQWLTGQGIGLPEMADAQALTRVGAEFSLASAQDVNRIENLLITLDDTSIRGDASVKGEAIGFNLTVDAIDADRYLPPAKEGAAEETASTSTGDEELFPVETLRELNLNGTVKIGSLVINRLKAEELTLTVKARNGKLDIGQKVGRFYDGGYQGRIGLEVSGKTPRLQVENSLQALQVGPLLQDLAGEDKLTGTGRFSSNISATGNSVNAIKRTLDGNLDFRFEDGAVKGINLAQVIRETRARFNGEAVPETQEPQQTDFSELSGSAVINKGVLSNQDLLAKSPYLRVDGKGKVNLVQESLDYTVRTVIVNTDKGQGGEGLDDLAGIPIPVKLTGPYASPNYSVDWGQVLVGTQKAKVEEKKEEVKQKLQEKLEDKLKGLFR